MPKAHVFVDNSSYTAVTVRFISYVCYIEVCNFNYPFLACKSEVIFCDSLGKTAISLSTFQDILTELSKITSLSIQIDLPLAEHNS